MEILRSYILEKSFQDISNVNCYLFSDTSFMVSYYEQMRGKRFRVDQNQVEIPPFDLNFLKT